MENTNRQKHEIVKAEANRWYETYKNLPTIIFIFTLIASFLIGLVFSFRYCQAENFGAGIGLFFLFLVVGLIVGAVEYFLIKIISSWRILQTEFLRDLTNSCEIKSNKENNPKKI